MKRYRKKPVEVEAIRLQDSSGYVLDKIYKFLGIHGRGHFPETGHGIDPTDGQFKISTLEGTSEGVMIVNIGDWILKYDEGEFYPCRNEIFRMTYECIGEVITATDN